MLKLNPEGFGVRRWGPSRGDEVMKVNSHDGIKPLIKSPREPPGLFRHGRTQGKDSVNRERCSADTSLLVSLDFQPPEA